ncbi:uncharacterized protein BDZ99DRAFT_461587 [Mytilinidion resinicola]|uniref:C2H2-type domain-containing protein n=1 Tax=Mytilinidion resinicola TaxID=574789 RepID=A0A6A6YRI8_9PEZI|nr:uncharacterized protein BDZ99DRAFT_461587 [Mytilinidion resinicola]KAF2811552.1 hypothetical protein BDZ99DRAFT_461587 [Mytilinidion resinicola]
MHHSTRIADLQGVLVQGLPESSHYKAVGVPKTSASSNKTTSGKQSSSSSELVPSSASGSIFQTSRQKRGRNANGEAIDGNDDSQDDNDEDRRRYTKGKRPCSRPQPRLKCPFYQRQPEKHGKRAACRGRGFMDMAKLKDHLKRVHSQPVRCPRCWQEMESDDAYVVHAQREEGCEKLPEPYDDRISRLKWSSLDFKTAPYSQLKSGGEKWRKLYNVLFPQDTEIPSPFEELRTSAQWEKFLPDVLYEELKNELGPLLEPVQSRIKERIPFIIQRCKAQMLSVPQTETNTSGSSSPISNSQEVVNQAITGAFHELDTYDSFTRHDVIPAEYISNLPPSSTTTEPNHYPQTNYGPDYRAPDFDFSWCLEDRHNRDLEESNSLG